MQNWLKLSKFDGSIVSTFMKMNVKSEDDNIKIVSSCVFISNKWLHEGNVFKRFSCREVRYLFFVSYGEKKECVYKLGRDKDNKEFILINIELLDLIRYMYYGLNNESDNSLGCHEFWEGLSVKFGDSVDKIISSGAFIFFQLSW